MPKKRKKIKKNNPMQTLFTRFMLVVAFFVFWIGGIGVRLVHLQISQHEVLLGKALNQRRDNVKEKQLRGTIYDRSGRALAMSVNVKSLYADPAEIENVEAAAKEISKALKLKPQEVLRTLSEAKANGKRFVWLARKLDESVVDSINKTLEDKDLSKADYPKFSGLHWREEQKRSYPYNSLAAQVIGFSNSEDVGSAGIEQSQEEVLHGAVTKGWQDRDRLGRVYEEDLEEREPPKDVILTLSNSIQYKVEQALEQGVKNSNAKSGMAIVLNPKTGEILAMANYPTFDPNKYNDFKPENFTNRAVHDVYSPGSVFKLVTYGAAINDNLINPNGEIDCRAGFIEVGGHRFNDPHATKIMSYGEAMAVSSNVAAIKTATSLGKDKFYGYAQKFGFGQPVGIELPAEANGIFRAPVTWSGSSLASMSIGYEIGVSALQMATAFATIANDGVRVQPHVIKEIRQADGNIFNATEAQKTQIVTAETARGLRKMLRQVVLNGTGKRAQLNGYTSAGKTGTAWKYNPKLKKIDSSKYVSSFIGMAPADNPEIVIAVVLDEPQGGARDGGQVSAPIFRQIAEQILPEMNVVPDGAVRQETLTAEQLPTEAVEVPSDTKSINDEDSDKTEKSDKSKETRKADKTEKKSALSENPQETKEKPASNDKKGSKTKTAVLTEKPKNETKNKSSGERTKQKT